MAREADADLIVTVGGGSVTDSAKAVQLCLANDIRSAEALDSYRPAKGPDGALSPPPSCKPPRGMTDEAYRLCINGGGSALV
jgi:maleylacetate reductase